MPALLADYAGVVIFIFDEYSGTRDTSVRAFGNQHSGK